MIINIIAGVASNLVIGNKNNLPWHYSEDLKHFKNLTTGHIVVMGLNTFFSIGKPLPNRRNIILTKTPVDIVGIEQFDSIEKMLHHLNNEGVPEIFVIGGASIYQQFLDRADFLYLTEIKKEYEGDTYFPEYKDKFVEQERQIGNEYDFVVYKKK